MGLPLLLLAAGTGVAVAGQMQAAKAAERESKNAAVIARHNAQVATQAGEARAQKLEREQVAHRKRAAAMSGTQTVSYARGGVLTFTGTPANVQIETQKNYALEIAQLGADANTERRFAASQSAGFGMEASSLDSRAKNALTSGYTKAASLLLLDSAGQ